MTSDLSNTHHISVPIIQLIFDDTLEAATSEIDENDEDAESDIVNFESVSRLNVPRFALWSMKI